MSLWRTEDPVIITQKEFALSRNLSPPPKNRENDPAVDIGGMFPAHRVCWQSEAFYKFLVGGYGSGKSLWLGKRMIRNTILNAPYPCLIVSPTYKMAKRTMIPTIKGLLDGRQIPYRYHKSDHYFTIRYRGHVGQLWVGSGNDPDSLKGSNVAATGIDEPFLQAYDVMTQITARTREPNARHSEICGAGTPEGIGGWGYDLCEGDLKKDYDIEIFRAKTSENLALPSHYLNNLRNTYDSKMLQAYFDGEFVTISNLLVYYNFSDANVKDIPDPGGDLCVGLDFNVNPMAGAIFWKHGDRMHYIDEIEIANSDTERWMRMVHEKYPGRIKDVYPDPTGDGRSSKAAKGRTDFTIIRNENKQFGEYPSCHIHKRSYFRKDRFNATNKKLEDGTLTVDKRCKKLIRYFKSSAHDDKDDSMTHLLDGATYPVAFLYPIKRPMITGDVYVG